MIIEVLPSTCGMCEYATGNEETNYYCWLKCKRQFDSDFAKIELNKKPPEWCPLQTASMRKGYENARIEKASS